MDDLDASIRAGAATALRRRAARQAQIATNWTTVGERGAVIRSGEAGIAVRISAALGDLAAELKRRRRNERSRTNSGTREASAGDPRR
jgi:hypothetical protein